MARNKQLVSKLTIMRVSRGFSQGELAEACGVDRSTLSLYESGKRKMGLENATKIARALRCPVESISGFVSTARNTVTKP